jgi:hypothetical protein
MSTYFHQHLQHQQTCTNASKILMGIGVTSNATGFDPVVLGAAPGSPELCLSYSGFITPGCDSGNMDSNSIRHPNETPARVRHRIRRHLLTVRKPDFQSGDTGSTPVDATTFLCAALAQGIEHVATNDVVGSSNLSCGSKSR